MLCMYTSLVFTYSTLLNTPDTRHEINATVINLSKKILLCLSKKINFYSESTSLLLENY